MRIRKRPVLFPSSSLSDPHLMNRSPVMVQLREAVSTASKPFHHASSAPPSSLDCRQPPDQSNNGSDDPSGESGAHRQHNKQDPLVEVVRREESGEDSGEKGNHTRKGGTQVMLPPLSSSTQGGRWYEGEKAIPLKKRRGNLEENNNNNNNANAGNSKKMKMKMKSKMNKKYCDEDSMEEDGEEKEETKVNVNVSKKRGRGSALMEGSRCSRVNGRGWRCCQQTLVGYSLCEHHLGKGRLRSMTSVRSRSIAASTTAPKKVLHHVPHNNPSSSSSVEKQNECVVAEPSLEEDDDEKKKPEIMTMTMTTKKRMKLGMVKARSISSLLGQANTQVAAIAHENISK